MKATEKNFFSSNIHVDMFNWSDADIRDICTGDTGNSMWAFVTGNRAWMLYIDNLQSHHMYNLSEQINLFDRLGRVITILQSESGKWIMSSLALK